MVIMTFVSITSGVVIEGYMVKEITWYALMNEACFNLSTLTEVT